MKLRVLVVPDIDEDIEIPQGWDILGRSFDRGGWSILLIKKDVATAKAANFPVDAGDLE